MSKADWPKDLEEAAWPLMDSPETINLKIKACDSQIRNLAEQPEFKEMVERVRAVYGVGINCVRFCHPLFAVSVCHFLSAGRVGFKQARSVSLLFAIRSIRRACTV